jgi:hypothetical protein
MREANQVWQRVEPQSVVVSPEHRPGTQRQRTQMRLLKHGMHKLTEGSLSDCVHAETEGACCVAYMHAKLGLLRIERQDAVSAHLADQVVSEQHHVMMAVSNSDQPVSPKQKNDHPCDGNAPARVCAKRDTLAHLVKGGFECGRQRGSRENGPGSRIKRAWNEQKVTP